MNRTVQLWFDSQNLLRILSWELDMKMVVKVNMKMVWMNIHSNDRRMKENGNAALEI